MSNLKTVAKAQALAKAGKFEEAIKAYKAVLRYAPKQPALNAQLGLVYFQAKQYLEAIPALLIARMAHPRNVVYWFNLLAAYHRLGQLGNAHALLVEGDALGIEAAQMVQIKAAIAKPPEVSVQAIELLIKDGKQVEAEIAVRLLQKDYPDDAGLSTLLVRINAMGKA